jgi:hypothetical protein
MSDLIFKNTDLNEIVLEGDPVNNPRAPDFTTSPFTSFTGFTNSRPLNVDFLYQGQDISYYYTAKTEFFVFNNTNNNFNRTIGSLPVPSNVKSMRLIAVSGGGGYGGEGGNLTYNGAGKVNSGGSGGGPGGWSDVGYRILNGLVSGDKIDMYIGGGGGNGNKGSNRNTGTAPPIQAGTGNAGGAGGTTKVYLNGSEIMAPTAGNGGNGGEGGRLNKATPANRNGKSPGNSGNNDGANVGYGPTYSSNWLFYGYGTYGASNQGGYVQIIYLFD